MKRFTETTKWDDPWFIDLSADAKAFWSYLVDKCDNAGVIDLSHRQANFLLNGSKSTEELIKEIGDRVCVLKSGKILVKGFVNFQYGELSEGSNLHKNVINTLKKHDLYDSEIKGISTLNEGLNKGTGKGNNKGKGEGIDKETRKEIFKNKVLENLDKYDSVMLNDFFEYWTESNEGSNVLRFEMKKNQPFNIGRRLGTWKKNDKGFKPKPDNGQRLSEDITEFPNDW